MKRKSTLLSFILAFGILPAAFSTTAFSANEPENWAKPFIREAVNTGVSCADADFESPITREEFCKYVFEMLNHQELITLQTSTTAFTNPFQDTDSQYVFTLYSEGIIAGKSDTEFDPGAAITRAEAASVLGRLIRFADVKSKGITKSYKDVEPDAYYRLPLAAATEAGIIEGDEAGNFAPDENISVQEAIAAIIRLKNAERADGASYARICDTVKNLVSYKRGAGSGNDKITADMLADTLVGYGYELTRQPFEFEENERTISSENIAAVKKASVDNPKILYITAHYDSMPSTVGANDNAVGTAVLMELARLLKDIPSETEFRFILFSAEEYLIKGSGAYCQALSEDEISRSIGAVNIDMIGGKDCGATMFHSVNGQPTQLSDFINEVCGKNYQVHLDGMSDHSSFSRIAIPSFSICQELTPYGNHSIIDRMETVDISVVQEVCQDVYTALKEIAENPSAVPNDTTSGDVKHHVISKDMPVYFSMKLDFVESMLGIQYEETEPPAVLEDGTPVDGGVYIYHLVWFDNNVPFQSQFRYDAAGDLAEVSIEMQKAGYSKEDAVKMISSVYGEPKISDEIYSWEYRHGLKCIDLFSNEDGSYSVSISCHREQAPYKELPVVNGEIQGEMNTRERLLWDAVKKTIPHKYLVHMSRFGFINDGVKGFYATTAMVDENGNFDDSKFEIAIDYQDYTDENGNYVEYNQLIHAIVHEFGHAVSYSDWFGTQINGDEYGQQTIENATELSLMKQFYDKFCKEGDGDIFTNAHLYSDRFVSKYASEKIYEDFPDVFAAFVLSDKTYNTSAADEQINWMYTIPQLVDMRNGIRANLSLD